MLSIKRVLLPVLALASLGMTSFALAAEPPLAASEQSVYVEKLRAEDTRLTKTVTVREKQIYLGALLKQISEQSGVSLTVLDKGRAADTQVSVFAKDMPVADVMDRLWSLLSYKDALWYWEKQDGAAGTKPAYQLVRSLAARDFPARMEGRLQAKLERDMEEALDALSLPKDQLAARGKDNPVIGSMAKDSRTYNKMAALNAALSRDDITALMRGEKAFKLQLDDLPQVVKDYVNSEDKLSHSTIGGTQGGFDGNGIFQLPVAGMPAPQPTMVRMAREDNLSHSTLPQVYFQYGYKIPSRPLDQPVKFGKDAYLTGTVAITSFEGGVVSGGVPQEKAWNASQEDFWMLPDDKKASDETKSLPTRKDDSKEPTIDESLEQFSGRTGIPVFARVLPALVYAPSAPATVATYVKSLRDGVYSCKWRGGSLMVADVRWWRQELSSAAKYPPGLLRDIEAAILSDPQQLLPLPMLCVVADQVGQGVPLLVPGDGIQPYLPLLASLAKKPDLLTELQSEAGIPCKRLPETAYRTLYTLAEQKYQMPPNLGARRLRTRVENEVKEKATRRILHFELITDGKAESLADFVIGTRDVSDL